MRKFERKDLILCGNLVKMLKRSSYDRVEFPEMIGATETWTWLKELRAEIEAEVALAEAPPPVITPMESPIS